jgi:hypothetical protein
VLPIKSRAFAIQQVLMGLEVSRVDVANVPIFERNLPQDAATDEVREARWSHAPKSPMPGEGREPERPSHSENVSVREKVAASQRTLCDGVSTRSLSVRQLTAGHRKPFARNIRGGV